MDTPDPAMRGFLRSVRQARVGAGEIALWYIGGAGYILRTAATTLLIDPFLGPSGPPDWMREIPPAFAPETIGELGVLDAMLIAGRVGAAAEGVGVARGAMDMTVDYLKQRKQFGRLIGEFQALQHRASHLYSEVEIARAVTIKAQQLLDAGAESADLMASVAKAKVAKTARLAVQEGVQMHGGMGMTDQFDIGFFMKRARVCQELFGDSNYHADQLARMKNY